jgi:cysteine synthase A
MNTPADLPTDGRYLDHVQRTPLVPVSLEPGGPTIWCKLEFLNPSGSTKDRIASYILEKAWRRGAIHAQTTVIEASSGSTSIALALACAQLGIRFRAVMPEGVSDERAWMIRALGGEVELSPRADGILGAINRVESFADLADFFLPRQFENPDNAAAHRVRTATEILAQIPGGNVDAVVSGVGTGGTLVGLFQGLSENGCQVMPVAAKPVAGGTFADLECCSFSTRIPGVVDGISKLYRPDQLPGLRELEIDDRGAMTTARRLIARGFPVGPSSGLNFLAALQVARDLGPSARIVTVLPDRMERYFSTELFRDLRGASA